MTAEERAQEIFQMDKSELTKSDVFLYVLDGRVPDEGAAVALGLLYMHREETDKDIHIIGFHTDKRSAYLGEKLNPMISSALDMVIETEEGLLEYLDDLENDDDGDQNDLGIKYMWNAYLASINETVDDTEKTYDAWSFGIGKEMANELAELVVEGKKTATASLHYLYELEGEVIPNIGDHSIILDGEGIAECVIKTVAVDIIPFNQVTAEFAQKEGEGDLSLKYWREGHRDFFTEELKTYEKSFEEDMLVVCEQFEVVLKPLGLEYELEGVISSYGDLDLEGFDDALIEFVESRAWYFGGGVGKMEMADSISINICISMDYFVDTKEVYNSFTDFLEKNKWSYQGTFKKIMDGYYINEDGSKGKYCMDDE